MNAMILDLGAVALCSLSVALMKETTSYSLSDYPIKYERVVTSDKNSKRVLVGRLLLGIAILFAGIGLLAQIRSILG
jgi:hypothetical protein